MHQEMSTVEMALIASTSERTVQRWIAEKKLPAEHIEHNRYRIDPEDLERLRLGTHYEEVRSLQRLEHRVNDLALEVAHLRAVTEALERHVEALMTSEGQSISRPPKSGSASSGAQRTSTEPPEPGALKLADFAKLYHVAYSTLQNQAARGIGARKEKLPIFSRPKPGREERETEYWVLPGQEHGVLDYWQRYGTPYTEPEQEP